MTPDPAPRIAVVGSIMVDMVAYASPLPAAGETVVGSRFQSGFGGKGANQAVMAALVGAEVTFVGAVGRDSWGEDAVANLRQYGINVDNVLRSGSQTGLAPIWVDESSGENRIIVIPGANNEVSSDFVRAALAETEFDAVVCQMEIPQSAVAEALEQGRARGAITVLNPAPWSALDLRLLKASDWLVPNESEFEGLRASLGMAATGPTPTAVGEVGLALGGGLAVTVGERGALVWTPARADPRPIAAPPVKARDTTGAGDAFVGAFAYGLAAAMEPADAAAFACQCAADSVTRFGTQSSFRRPALGD